MSLKHGKGYGMQKRTSQGRQNIRNSYKKKEKTRPIKIHFSWPKMPPMGNFWMTLVGMSLGVLGIAALSFGLLALYDQATSSEYFATKHIEVLGNKRLSKQMIQDIAGVALGDNSLDISIAKLESALITTPWVESVSVKRVLPDRFIIQVKERLPAFWVRKDTVLYYADEQGTIIAPVETEHFVSLPTLEVEKGSETELKKLSNYLEDLKSGYLPVEFGAISALKISAGRGMELYLDDREILLSIALDSWEKNLQRLSITIGDLVRRNELSKVKEVRATDGNVWVIKNV